MNEPHTLRPATAADLDQLLEFEQELIAYERPHSRLLKEGQISYYNIEDLIASERSLLLIAETSQALIACGYAQIRDSREFHANLQHAYLGFMYVDPNYRGRGINKQIMQGLQDWAIKAGIREFRLDVYASNSSAISAYRKAGYATNLLEMVLEL